MDLCSLYRNLRHRVKSRFAKPTAAAPHSATLAKLPPEILHLILCHLCKHCTRPADLEFSDLDNGKLALRGLCLVCRALRPPAQAFLVHSLWLRFGLGGYRKGKDDGNFAILRTLTKCPDLATSVRRMTLGGSEMALRPGRLELVRDAEPKRTFRTESAPSRAVDEVFFTRLTRDLLVSLAQNLTELSFPLGLRRGERRAADVAATARFAQQAKTCTSSASMSALQTLTLLGERGSDFVLNDPRICLLLSAAPRLRRLVMDGLDSVVAWAAEATGQGSSTLQQIPFGDHLDDLPTMQHLHSIRLQNCMVANDASGRNLVGLQAYIAMAPNLRRFQYSAGCSFDHNSITGSRVLSMLEPVHDTLVDLGLRFNGAVAYLDGEPGDSLQSLAQFTRLRILRLDERVYCYSRHPRQSGQYQDFGEAAPPECLTMILPQSVRVLHLELLYGCTTQCDALHLATQVAGGRFPNLSHVQIEAVLKAPPHGAVQLENTQQAINAG